MNRNKMLLSAAFFAITGATYSMQAQQIKVESRGDTTLLRIANPPQIYSSSHRGGERRG